MNQVGGQPARLFRWSDLPPDGDVMYRIYLDTDVLCLGESSLTTDDAGNCFAVLTDDWLADDPIQWISKESEGAICSRVETRPSQC